MPTQGVAPHIDLVPVQPAGSQLPLFYLHVHWIGGAFYLFSLAHELGPDQPLYVINPYRFDGMPVPPSIEEMATAYIEALRTVQPTGPYRFAGFCGGGLIGYEIAQQLRAQGETVDILILIDPMAGPIRTIRMLGSTIRRLGTLLGVGADQQVDWFLRVRYISRTLRRARDEYSEHVDRLLQRWRDEHPRRFFPIPAAEALRQDWMSLFIWAVSGYVPRPYAGTMAYLFAKDNPDGRGLWWGAAVETDTAKIHFIPGTHTTCRTEHLQALARQTQACLRAASQ
jgi:thioesterase domain-containing protein